MMKRTLIVFVTLLALQLFALAQPKKVADKLNTIKEGSGVEGVVVGRSTMDDVVKKFGKDYKWIAHKKYSYQMSYPEKGLAFYLCQSDKRKQIFLIEIKQPYKGKTSQGIILGQSTLEDVHKRYGKLKSGLEYRGVSFYYNKYGKRNVITEIDITERSGIRQCKENK